MQQEPTHQQLVYQVLCKKAASAKLAATDNPTIIGSMGSMSTAQAICEHNHLRASVSESLPCLFSMADR